MTSFQSGDEPEIPLVKVGDSVEEVSERWAVAQKMKYITQYTFSGDTTGSQPLSFRPVRLEIE